MCPRKMSNSVVVQFFESFVVTCSIYCENCLTITIIASFSNWVIGYKSFWIG